MPTYIVTANKFRMTKKVTENGQTRTESTKYVKGDTVEMSADDAARLLRSGGLVEEGTDLESVKPGARLPNSAAPLTPEPVLTSPASPGARSGQTATEGLSGAPEPTPDAIEAHQEALRAAEAAREEFNEAQGGAPGEPQAPGEGGESTEDEGDGYDDLDYGDLQNLAKERGLEHTGKKTAIIERLREHDEG